MYSLYFVGFLETLTRTKALTLCIATLKKDTVNTTVVKFKSVYFIYKLIFHTELIVISGSRDPDEIFLISQLPPFFDIPSWCCFVVVIGYEMLPEVNLNALCCLKLEISASKQVPTRYVLQTANHWGLDSAVKGTL